MTKLTSRLAKKKEQKGEALAHIPVVQASIALPGSGSARIVACLRHFTTADAVDITSMGIASSLSVVMVVAAST